MNSDKRTTAGVSKVCFSLIQENIMGVITDILKGIPLSSVLRERLADKETEMAALKQENAALKAENAILKTENMALHAKFQQVERDKTVHGDSCPYCQQPKGKLLDIKPHPIMWEAGVKVYYYECQGCGKKYDRQKES